MRCPYCGDSSHVIEVGTPTVALLQTYAIALGFGVLSVAAAAAMAATYRLTGKRIYKCTSCDKLFIA